MAEGVRWLLQSSWALSTTGVAGPTPQDDSPVGTVFVGCAGPDGTVVRHLTFVGDRDEIRRQSVEAALSLLVEQLASS
jgi:nicotinamide-nucleotide amidase